MDLAKISNHASLPHMLVDECALLHSSLCPLIAALGLYRGRAQSMLCDPGWLKSEISVYKCHTEWDYLYV